MEEVRPPAVTLTRAHRALCLCIAFLVPASFSLSCFLSVSFHHHTGSTRAWILKGGTPSMAGVEPNIHIPDERAHASAKAAFHSPGNKGKIIINQAQPCTLGPASLEPMIWQDSGSEHVSQLLQVLQRFPTSLRIKSTLLQQPTGLCRSDPSRLEAPPGPLVRTPRTPHHRTELSGFAHALPSARTPFLSFLPLLSTCSSGSTYVSLCQSALL